MSSAAVDWSRFAPEVEVQVDGAVATVTMNRPEVMNAIDHAQRLRLTEVFGLLRDDDDVRVVVLAGKGRAFCAGQDQRESATMDAHGAAGRIEEGIQLLDALRGVGKPVIARIEGHAMGAGLQLALHADLRIAGPAAKFGMTEFKVGSPAIAGSAALRDIIGEAAMKAMVLECRIIEAPEALAIGLVNQLVAADAIEARIAELAASIAGRAAPAVRLTKNWWRAMSEESFQRTAEQMRRAHSENFSTGSVSAGAAAFLAKGS